MQNYIIYVNFMNDGDGVKFVFIFYLLLIYLKKTFLLKQILQLLEYSR